MHATKRFQNGCKRCGYTWYPRGHNLSRSCPNCGSADVGFDLAGLWLLLIGVIVADVVYVGSFVSQRDTELSGFATSSPEPIASQLAALPTTLPTTPPAPQPYPREITIISSVQFPVTVEGRSSGSLRLFPGTKLQLVSVHRDTLVVRYLNSTATIPESATNLQRSSQ